MLWARLLNPHRVRGTTIPGDHRDQFERDYDRTVFSTPVKRLQDKAQVFPLDPNDSVRTRLTHSLEVSSVARGLARAICKNLTSSRKISGDMDRQIEVIAATCGLIHDLGNPPFGHAGEEAIREWFKTQNPLSKQRRQLIQDFCLFEGNAQTLRLVSKLQVLADFNGLNLTLGTLSAACKYTAASHEAKVDHLNHAKSKVGYFASEEDLVKRVRRETGTGGARNPITFIVEAADDVVYSVADLEDAVKKGILSWQAAQNELTALLIQPKENKAKLEAALQGKDRILSAAGTDLKNLPDDVHAAAFRTAVIGIVVSDVTKAFHLNYSKIMSGKYQGELAKDCDAWCIISALKQLGIKRIYNTAQTIKLELMGRRIIEDLMDIFWEGARSLPIDSDPKTKDFPGRIGALLSANYRKVFQHSVKSHTGLPEKYHRLQLVTDYVCGMTDSFAQRLHSELTNA